MRGVVSEVEYIHDLTQKVEASLSRAPAGTAAAAVLKDETPHTTALVFNNMLGSRLPVFLSLPPRVHLEVITLVNSHTRRNILHDLPDAELVEILHSLDGRGRHLFLKSLDRSRIERLSPHLIQEVQKSLARYTNYPKRSVGYVMQVELASVTENVTVGEARQLIKNLAPQVGQINQLYVVDDKANLLGVVPITKLFGAEKSTKVKNLIVQNIPALPVHMHQERAAHLFRSFDIVEAPVVDGDKLVGRLLVQDALDILEQEFTEDIQKLGGISGADEMLDTPPAPAARRRLPWMAANIFLDLIAVTAIMPFEETIAQVTALAVLMPIISDMGGNVGIQALTVSVRSLATRHIGWRLPFYEIRKEMFIGLMNGFALGALIGLVGALGWGNPYLGLVVGVAMFFNTIMASVAGGTLPIILKKLKQDPALMSGAILTTITDFTGFLIFLGLATILLPYLG
jgi:magnesium transporter